MTRLAFCGLLMIGASALLWAGDKIERKLMTLDDSSEMEENKLEALEVLSKEAYRDPNVCLEIARRLPTLKGWPRVVAANMFMVGEACASNRFDVFKKLREMGEDRVEFYFLVDESGLRSDPTLARELIRNGDPIRISSLALSIKRGRLNQYGEDLAQEVLDSAWPCDLKLKFTRSWIDEQELEEFWGFAIAAALVEVRDLSNRVIVDRALRRICDCAAALQETEGYDVYRFLRQDIEKIIDSR